jgi:hypothetical protein
MLTASPTAPAFFPGCFLNQPCSNAPLRRQLPPREGWPHGRLSSVRTTSLPPSLERWQRRVAPRRRGRPKKFPTAWGCLYSLPVGRGRLSGSKPASTKKAPLALVVCRFSRGMLCCGSESGNSRRAGKPVLRPRFWDWLEAWPTVVPEHRSRPNHGLLWSPGAGATAARQHALGWRGVTTLRYLRFMVRMQAGSVSPRTSFGATAFGESRDARPADRPAASVAPSGCRGADVGQLPVRRPQPQPGRLLALDPCWPGTGSRSPLTGFF